MIKISFYTFLAYTINKPKTLFIKAKMASNKIIIGKIIPLPFKLPCKNASLHINAAKTTHIIDGTIVISILNAKYNTVAIIIMANVIYMVMSNAFFHFVSFN